MNCCSGLALSATALLLTCPAWAQQAPDRLDRLEAELRDQQERIEELEAALEQHHGVGVSARTPTEPQNIQTGAVTGGEFAGSLKAPGSELSIRIGGYVKLDGIVDFDPIGDEDQFSVSAIPTADGGGFDHRTRFHARQSRIFIEAQDGETAYGPFRVFLEMDFFGSGGDQLGNSHGLRLRQAYGSLGRVLAGQTWTTFMDAWILPDLLDFHGPSGELVTRQAQLRVGHDFDNGVQLAAALENPETDVRADPSDAGTRLTGVDELPDAVLRARWARDFGHLQSAILLRRLSVQDAGIDDNETGWGYTVSGRLMLAGRDQLFAQLSLGKGMARYMNDLSGLGLDAAVRPDGRIEALPVIGGYAGYQHWWSEQLRSSFVYGQSRVDLESYQPEATFERGQYAAANLIWSPLPQTNFGVEYLYGKRENKSGAEGDARRLQVSSQLMF